MPKIKYKGQELEVKSGANLKTAIKKAGLSVYNGNSKYFNCKGLGTCGTCAVFIKGSISTKTAIEKWRLNFPPHTESDNLRLSCQVKVMADIEVKKHEGFWGQKVH